MARRLEMKHQLFGYLSAALFGLVAFQNCSPVGFEAEPLKAGSLAIPGWPISPDEEVVNKACDGGQIYSQVATLNFPRPQKIYNNSRCDWNNAGNGGLSNDHFMARLEQTQSVTVPQGAKICDISFSSPTQEWLYDDHVFVTMDDVLLASSHPIHDVLTRENGLAIFDWTKIYTQKWKQIPAYIWCEGMTQGLSSCSWPASQDPGEIKLSYSPRLFQKIVARDLNRTTHVFKFVTTGDDNPDSDCDHSDLTFDVQVKYAY